MRTAVHVPVIALFAVVGTLPAATWAEIPIAIYDEARPGERPIWVSSRSFDAQGIPDLDLLAPQVAERLRTALKSGRRAPSSPDPVDWLSPSRRCDIASRISAEYPDRVTAADIFGSVVSAHVGQIAAVETGFYHSVPATLIEVVTSDDFTVVEEGLHRQEAVGRSRYFVYPAARLEIGGLSVCDLTADDLPPNIVGSDAIAFVERQAVAGIARTSERLLVIRPPAGKIFAPSVLRGIDLTGDLSSTVAELHRLWKEQGVGR